MENFEQEEHNQEEHKIVGKTKVYAWGNGKGGNLGNGSEDYEALPYNIKELNGKSIVKIQCGEWYGCALTASGVLYGWGKTSRNRFGVKADKDMIATPTKIPLSVKVKAFSGGYWHSLVVDTEGKVYGVGDNKKGALGLGHTTDGEKYEEIKSLTEPVTMVAAGSGYSLFITESNALYSGGQSASNGLKKTGTVDIPSKVNIDSDVGYIDAGVDHAAAVTSDGKLYTWGSNVFGQLGHGKASKSKIVKTPKLVEALEGVHVINVSGSKGLKHCQTAGVDSTGKAYFWGCGYKGKLGNTDEWGHKEEGDEDEPRALKVENIALAESAGIHSSIVDNEGVLYTFGGGSHGRLAHQKYLDGKYVHLYKESQPKRVEFFDKVGKIIDYSSTYSSNVALVELN